MDNKQKISIITGASGRIGFPLILQLKKRGDYVKALCRSDNAITALIREVADEVVFGDVTNLDSLEQAFNGCDYVYHLAGVISIQSKPQEVVESVNVGGTANVIQACMDNNVTRLIHCSSVHAVHFTSNSEILTEPKRFSPELVHGQYAKTKAIGSNLVLDAVQKGLDAVIAMPSGVIGPYEYTLSNFGQMIADTAKGKMKIYLKGEYDFVDTRDVCFALCELATKGVKGESYFVSGHKSSVKNLIDTVADYLGVKRAKVCVPRFIVKMAAPIAERRSLKKGKKPTFTPYSIKVLGDNCNFSHEKLKELTGYSPMPLKNSLEDQADFILANKEK